MPLLQAFFLVFHLFLFLTSVDIAFFWKVRNALHASNIRTRTSSNRPPTYARNARARRKRRRKRRRRAHVLQVIKLDENESTSIKVAQLVQWGGAPAALARDSEPRGHAKRVQHECCTRCPMHSPSAPDVAPRALLLLLLFYPPAPLPMMDFFSFLAPRCARFAHMQRPLSGVSLAVMLSGPGKLFG